MIRMNIRNKMNNHRFGGAMLILYANKYIYPNKIFIIQLLNSYSIHEYLMSLYSKTNILKSVVILFHNNCIGNETIFRLIKVNKFYNILFKLKSFGF